jgi:hypothetical protein
VGKLQVQNGSYMLAVPPMIAEYLEATKGSVLNFKINKKTGQVEVVKEEVK